ncbi:MAG: hypothetical protein KDD45_00715 [Bdellovibrionales bacterium]|nr:hypothetical protein [Bdellovibrionales bacterium]
MEDLAPPLMLISYIKRATESGFSIKEGLIRYLNDANDEFSKQVKIWFLNVEAKKVINWREYQIKSSYRKALLRLLERGLNKESVYQQLLILEQEVIIACQAEIDERLTKLPYILMIPVLFFQFPALLILIMSPLVQNFIESMK